ncbi:MAG TPA: tRNA-dihydrouridine synthase [Polyangia bacterium]|jgi:nifR3 family TIM-barrel protein
MKLGRITLDPPVILAPMHEVTDLAFRTLCEELGAGITVTEFLNAHGLAAGARGIVRRMTASLGGRPFGVQIYGRDLGPMARAAAMAADSGAAFVDVNMGCPAKKVVWGGAHRGGDGACRGAGVALMLDPDHAARIVEAVRGAVPDALPVTVKHRVGWDERHRNAADFARRLVDAGAAMITVHGRTKVQGYSGAVDLAAIRAVRAAVPPAIPVVGNGDVIDAASYHRMRTETGCDAVMVGRAAMTGPWVFTVLRAAATGAPPPPPITVAERRRVFLRHVALSRELAPEGAFREMRHALCRYVKGLRGASELRPLAFNAPTPEELLALAERFFEGAQAS